jgi:hypothetical protein
MKFRKQEQSCPFHALLCREFEGGGGVKTVVASYFRKTMVKRKGQRFRCPDPQLVPELLSSGFPRTAAGT